MNQMAFTAVMTQMFAAGLHMKQPRRRGIFQGNSRKLRTHAITVGEVMGAARLTQL